MKLVDANILICAWDLNSPHHIVCKNWLERHLNSPRKLGIPWNSALAFTRIVSNPRIYERPVSTAAAWEQVREWLEVDSVFVPEPMKDHALIVHHILSSTRLFANDLPDVHLVALAIEHGLVLCSTDADFSKYRDITWENPLDSRQF